VSSLKTLEELEMETSSRSELERSHPSGFSGRKGTQEDE
jgi:hypothetical protein